MTTIANDVVRVLVADDDFDMRLLVRATVDADSHIEVVGEAIDGSDAVRRFEEIRPQVCVLDYRMPELNGLEAAAKILELAPETRILLFSAYLTPEVIAAARDLGVRCMRKDAFLDLPGEILALAG